MVSSESAEVSESELAATIFIESVVLLDEVLEDEPLDKDLPDEDLPKVLLGEVFNAKFDLDNFSSCLCLQHLEAVCPLFL